MPGSNYVIKKQCTNCAWMNEKNNKSCSQCNYLFVYEASPEEEAKFNDRLFMLRQRAGGKVDKEE